MKSDKMSRRSSLGSLVRKRLSDITNHSHSNLQSKVVNIEENHKEQPQITVSDPSKDLINQLIKEKVTLMKLVEERDKIIATSNNQMRNLRIQYQKLQMQNWHLAQSNSQMLAEFNIGREKVKALQHELVCKDGLLKAKKLELEGKAITPSQDSGSQESEKKPAGECSCKDNNEMRPSYHRRRRAARSQSLGPPTTSKQGTEKEKLENKRRCVRRQSVRYKSEEQEASEKFFELDVVTLPIQKADAPTSSAIKEGEKCNTSNDAQTSERSSLGRPVRRAAEKVQSYKEAPLNVKMRRNA